MSSNLIPALPDRQGVEKALKKKVSELPTLPVVALKLLKLTSEDSSKATDLAMIVETDPAIAAKVLRLVNSAHYALRRKVSSLSHAVVILGFTAIRAMALEVTLFEQLVRHDPVKRFDRTFFWRHCLSVAGLSKALALASGHPDPEEVYAAGLLHDIGKLILDVYGKISYRRFLQGYSRTSAAPLIEEERNYIGITHNRIGAFFCAEWKIPTAITLAVLFHHGQFVSHHLSERDKLLCAIVALADFITWTQGIGSVEVAAQPSLEPDIEQVLSIEELDLRSLLVAMDREVKGVAKFYDFAFPGPDEFRTNLLAASINLSKLNAVHLRRQEELDTKLRVLSQFHLNLAASKLHFSRSEIIDEIFQAIHKDFGFDRITLLQIVPEERSLRPVQSCPRQEKEHLRFAPLTIAPTNEKLLDCLRDRNPVILNSIIDGEVPLLQSFHATEMAIIPLTTHARTTGLLTIDNTASGRPLLPTDLSLLAIIANELGVALENARVISGLKEKAELDGLTGIYNRGALDQLMAEACRHARHKGLSVVLGILDVDFFKKFNDTYGHPAGDSILKLLAATVKKMSRPTDIVGRFGGEEFAFLLPGHSLQEGRQFAERLRHEIEVLGELLHRRFPRCSLTVSIGLAAAPGNGTFRDELFKLADQALYEAKTTGRNRVCVAPENSQLSKVGLAP